MLLQGKKLKKLKKKPSNAELNEQEGIQTCVDIIKDVQLGCC